MTVGTRNLRERQYRDGSRLAARARLHARYGRDDWLDWLVAQMPWPTGGRVIDVGCGAGAFWTAAAAPMDVSVTLLDLSPGMVVEATTRRPAAAGLAADAAALPFADAVFDAALCIHMLYHLPDPAKGVAELRRVLRPSGHALVATNGRTHLAELHALKCAVFGSDPGDPAAAAFGLEQAEPVLRAAFESVELVRFPDTLRCTDVDDVVAYILSLPEGDGASDDDVARLRAAVADAFDDGVLTIRKDVGVLRCRA